MAVAFDVGGDLETRIEFEDVPPVELALPTMTVTITTPQAALAIDVDPDDLARALVTASPVFAQAVADIVGYALLELVSEA